MSAEELARFCESSTAHSRYRLKEAPFSSNRLLCSENLSFEKKNVFLKTFWLSISFVDCIHPFVQSVPAMLKFFVAALHSITSIQTLQGTSSTSHAWLHKLFSDSQVMSHCHRQKLIPPTRLWATFVRTSHCKGRTNHESDKVPTHAVKQMVHGCP